MLIYENDMRKWKRRNGRLHGPFFPLSYRANCHLCRSTLNWSGEKTG